MGHVVESLEGFSVKASDLQNAFQRIAGTIDRSAHGLVPKLSGRLAASIKPSKAKSKATVRAGGARVPYAGVQNYGMYHNIQAKFFMNKALEQNEARSVAEIERELDSLIVHFQLNN
ncbi:hypothetical protein [Streptomyces prunicolor]|uniref:hypothetical protein n=1 Tax=Streptomyces prunicolor TaxID=67348 RepID=UPI00131A3E49|nr:hypothetical protein [Streptomyces prunicolor]